MTNALSLDNEVIANLFKRWLIEKKNKSENEANIILNASSFIKAPYVSRFYSFLNTAEGQSWLNGTGVSGSSYDVAPQIIKVEPVNAGQIPVGGPAQLVVTYTCPYPFYMRLDLLPKFSWSSGGFYNPGSYAWVNGKWQSAPAGTNKKITLAFNSVPLNWYPSNGVRALDIKIDYSLSSSGSGDKQLLQANETFWIVDADQETEYVAPVVKDSTKPDYNKTTDEGATDGNGDTGNGGGTDTTVDPLAWIKKNWIIVALIGALVFLVIPERSSKKED